MSFTVAAARLVLALAAQEAAPASTTPEWTTFEAQIDGLAEPIAAAIGPNDEIFVVESFAHRVRVFDRKGTELRSFGAEKLSDPHGITIGSDGAVYVADTGNDRVEVFDRNGTFLRGIYGEFRRPLGICAAAERLYVTDSLHRRVHVLDRSGRFLHAIGAASGAGALGRPVDVAVDTDRRVYVADSDRHVIQRYDADGEYLGAWGDFGPRTGLFMSPSGLAVHAGLVYVTDRDNHRIQAFAPDGRVVALWGVHAIRPHEGHGKLHYPTSIAIAPSGDFAVVVESFENRCQIFGRKRAGDGETLTLSQNRDTAAHYALGVDAARDVCVLVEPSGPDALVLDLTQETPIEITRFGSHGVRYGQFLRPVDIELDPKAETCYVADAGTARISRFRISRAAGEPLRYDMRLARFVEAIDLESAASKRGALWPTEIAALECARSGELYVADSANARVIVLSPGLEIVRTFGGVEPDAMRDPLLRLPTSIALSKDEQRLYVVDALAACVWTFGVQGEIHGKFDGTNGDGPGFVRPFGIAAGVDGFVYVTDEGAHRVLKFDEDGRFVAAFGKQGLGRVEFYKPQGIVQHENGKLFVIDAGNHRAQILDGEGRFLDTFGARFYTQPARTPR
ncbi:MAG: 6-bladed beta-propeller [Planctomycetota bacterium]